MFQSCHSVLYLLSFVKNMHKPYLLKVLNTGHILLMPNTYKHRKPCTPYLDTSGPHRVIWVEMSQCWWICRLRAFHGPGGLNTRDEIKARSRVLFFLGRMNVWTSTSLKLTWNRMGRVCILCFSVFPQRLSVLLLALVGVIFLSACKLFFTVITSIFCFSPVLNVRMLFVLLLVDKKAPFFL